MSKNKVRPLGTPSDGAAVTRRGFIGVVAPLVVAPVLTTHCAPRAAYAADVEALSVEEIAPGVFVHQGLYEVMAPGNRGDIANTSIVIGDDSVAVIDTLGSASVGARLRQTVRQLTDRPIRYVVNTHMHPDHILGNAVFKADNPEFIAHRNMGRALAARAGTYMRRIKDLLGADAFVGTEIVLPTKLVEDRMELDLGGRKLICEAQKKTAHTNNDLIARDTKTDTLFLGDLLFSGHVPTIDGSIVGWLSLLDDLEAIKAARVVPGHGPATMPYPDALLPEKRYLAALATDVRKMIADEKTIDVAAKEAGQAEHGAWKLFDHYHARNVTTAFAELEWE